MKVFLTGGTGYLGNWIGRELMQCGHQVVVLAREPMRAAGLVGLGAEILQGDLLNEASWKPHLAHVDAVIHSAGLVKAWGPSADAFDAMNLHCTDSILRAARQVGLSRIVVTGSLFSLGPSSPAHLKDESALALEPHPVSRSNDYVRSKTLSSRRVYKLQQKGAPVIQVFPTLLVGPGVLSPGNNTAALISKMEKGRLPGLVGSGEQVWNFVGVTDAARGHVLALERGKPGENYLLGGDNWTQRQFFEFVAMELGRKPPRRKLGRRFPLWIAGASEVLAKMTGGSPALTRGEVLLSHEPWAFSSDKARLQLGYQPAPMEDVLRETVAWLRTEIWPRGKHHES